MTMSKQWKDLTDEQRQARREATKKWRKTHPEKWGQIRKGQAKRKAERIKGLLGTLREAGFRGECPHCVEMLHKRLRTRFLDG
jgi:hypothetical protein